MNPEELIAKLKKENLTDKDLKTINDKREDLSKALKEAIDNKKETQEVLEKLNKPDNKKDELDTDEFDHLFIRR